MFELKKLNVHKVVGTEKEKSVLISKGFKLVKEIKEPVKPVEEEKSKYEEMDYNSLKAAVKAAGLEGYGNAKKSELIAALENLDK